MKTLAQPPDESSPNLHEFKAVPAELKRLPQWVCWAYINRDGQKSKVPFKAVDALRTAPKLERKASVDDPSTWCDFSTAVRSATSGPADGPGFVLTGNENLVAFDLDHCRDGETGKLEEWARDFVARLNSYSEITPSGEGVRVWARGRWNHERNRSGRFEVYSKARYLTVTAAHIEGTPRTIEARQDVIDAIAAEVFDRPEDAPTPAHHPVSTVALNLSDSELLDKARSAKDGHGFVALYDRGDVSAYDGDESRADAALLAKLRFWTGADKAQAFRLFEASALCRSKWTKRADYRDRTWEAVANGNVYQPVPTSTDDATNEVDLSQLLGAKSPEPWKVIRDSEIEAIFKQCALWPVIESCLEATVPRLPIQSGLAQALALAGCALSGKDDAKPASLSDYLPKRGAKLARLRIHTGAKGQVAAFWLLCVAPPSQGKDVGGIASGIAGQMHWLLGSSMSAEGFLDALIRKPNGLVTAGEFENYLNPKHWQYAAVSTMNSIFSDFWFHQMLSSRGKDATPREADFAAPSFIANIQPERLLKLGNNVLGNGFFNRWLLLAIPKTEYRPRTGDNASGLKSAVDALACYTRKQGDITPPQGYLQGVIDTLKASHAPHEGYWRRLVNEYGPRLAIVLSVRSGDTSKAVHITDDVWAKTATVLLWLYGQAESLLSRLQREPDSKWESLLDRVEAVIRERGPCTIKTVHQYTGGWDTPMRLRALLELEERGRIRRIDAGKKAFRYITGG